MADHHLHLGLSAVDQPAGSPRAGVSRLGGGSHPRTARLLVRPADRHQRTRWSRSWEIQERGFWIGRLGLSGRNLVPVHFREVVAVRGRSVLISSHFHQQSCWNEKEVKGRSTTVLNPFHSADLRPPSALRRVQQLVRSSLTVFVYRRGLWNWSWKKKRSKLYFVRKSGSLDPSSR